MFWGELKAAFKRIWSAEQTLYNLLLDAFFAVIAIIVALQLTGYKGIAMIYFWLFLGIVSTLVVLTLVRIKMEPKNKGCNLDKDTVERLIQAITDKSCNLDNNTAEQLTQAIQELKGNIQALTQEINNLRGNKDNESG